MASRPGSRSQPGRTKATTLHFDDRHVMRWKPTPPLVDRRATGDRPAAPPWPLRWAVAALVLGFSGSDALWASGSAREIAGLDRQAKDWLVRLRKRSQGGCRMRREGRALAHGRQLVAACRRVAQDRLTQQQVLSKDREHMALKSDLAFFERLLPPSEAEGCRSGRCNCNPGQASSATRSLGDAKRQALTEFKGRLELTLAGTLDGKAWALPPDEIRQPSRAAALRASGGSGSGARTAVVKKPPRSGIIDAAGVVRATHTARQ